MPAGGAASLTDPLGVALVVSTVLAGLLTVLVWGNRPKAGATVLAVAAAIVGLWSAGHVLVVVGRSDVVRGAGVFLAEVPLAFLSVAWLAFAMQYTGRDDLLIRPVVAALLIEPIAFVGLLVTNDVHGLVITGEIGQAITVPEGPAYLLHSGYEYTVMSVANGLLFVKFLASRNVYRVRTFILLLINAVPTAGHVLSVLGVSPLPYTALGPVLFLGLGVVGALAFVSDRALAAVPLDRALGLFSGRSRNLAPVARDTAIEQLDSGFVVTDHRNRVVDINPTGKEMLGGGDDRIVGKPLTSVLSREAFEREDVPFLDDPTSTGEYRGVWVKQADGGRRCFDVTVTELESGGSFVGRVGLIHDVTERERRKQKLEARTDELERQNEQLESFANVVSHDLRNPLNVADGRLELVEAEDTEHLSVARRALSRMETLIDDVLALASMGQSISETETVDIGDVAEAAWETVRTPTATLVVEDSRRVEADRDRLRQVFENLFRNSVEHAGETVTVTVGTTPNGFFVADDGPGIPPDIRESIFEEGVTTHENGTGFGLSIVETIVDAHGWDVTATDSDSGGARFEIHSVDTSPAAYRAPADA